MNGEEALRSEKGPVAHTYSTVAFVGSSQYFHLEPMRLEAGGTILGSLISSPREIGKTVALHSRD